MLQHSVEVSTAESTNSPIFYFFVLILESLRDSLIWEIMITAMKHNEQCCSGWIVGSQCWIPNARVVFLKPFSGSMAQICTRMSRALGN